MSDSENELLPRNAFTYRNESTTVCAKGPNINSTNITSVQNNGLSSTMNMPWNFERQAYPEHIYNHRAMGYRRETSPMSIHSDRPRNFQYSNYAGRMSSQRSIYNGRSGSPISMRSKVSNASVTSADIAKAIENDEFNKYDLIIIKAALHNKLMQKKVSKGIEKPRNKRLLLKGYRRKSGDLGSDLSSSSDDCRSTHSAMYKDNLSSCRSTRTDITNLRRSIKESNMYKDCTNSLQNSAFRNPYSVPLNSTSMPHRSIRSINQPSQNPSFNQKERFQNGFLLPSQRFNKSVASVPISETQRIQNKLTSWNSSNNTKNDPINQKSNAAETDSDQEEIFSEVTERERSIHISEPQQKTSCEKKRNIELEENDCSDKKRTKLSSPRPRNISNKKTINVLKGDNSNEQQDTTKKVNYFEFLKPQFPVRKRGSAKFKEQLISKSAAPLTDVILPPPNLPPKELQSQIQVDHPVSSISHTNTDKTIDEQTETLPHSTSDLSMRPSFKKRKLFSQTMDVTEKRDLNTEAINANSPEKNVYSDIHREKHKARKVVTSQSCLNRDIAQEDNNLSDLIRKIVPPDRMNVTNMTNKSNPKLSQESYKHNNYDKWDVTSVISMCNNDDVSDTYTDEEIFNDKKKSKRGNKEKPDKSPAIVNECKIDLPRLENKKEMTKPNSEFSKPLTPKNVVDKNKNKAYNCVKSFWDTDFESDIETPGPERFTGGKENQNKSTSQHITKNKTQKINLDISVAHNTSLSESLKYKTNNSILDNTTSKLKKYNINRNLTIKAFRTPKITPMKNLESVDDTAPPQDKEENKKNYQQNDASKTKVPEKKINVNATKGFQNIIQSSVSKPKISKIAENKLKNKNPNISEPQTKTKVTLGKTKSSDEIHNNDANVTITKSLRISKKKTCCSDHINTNKVIKSSGQVKENKSSKLNKSKDTTNFSNVNKISKTKQPVQNNKKNEVKADQNEEMTRTLRTRKIDLSYSINTSDDCANITFRSLRSRKINLSSSIYDSTLEGNLTVVAKKLQRTPAKKNVAEKPIRNATKRGRPKNNVKG